MTIDGEEYWTDQTAAVEEADNEIEITSAEATAANTILITFAEAVPFDTEITVQKSTLTTTTTGTVTFDEDYKGATFVASANFTTGTYIVTAESDDSSDTAEVEITTQRVDDIVITSTTALTGPANNQGLKTDAYVYYKVFDQYGEDITENTSVEINGSYTKKSVDRNTGRITFTNPQGFRYNDLITVSIVHAQSGTVETKSLNIGLEQYIDTISVAGFLSLSEPTKLQSTIPAGFNKNEWLVLFKGYDQDGNEMAVDAYDYDTDVTVTTTATLLIGTDSFKKGSAIAGGANSYTIDGKDYSAFTIQPGMYVDKGGEATLNIISNKTGTQSFETIEIGAQDVLQALVLNDPGTVTDGDTVTIPYTATTTTGNSTTDFETIVRSTNKLTLTASVGVLSVREDNDGNAVVKWTDNIPAGTNYLDNVDRPVTFTTVVVGGDANTTTIYVSDFAYPVAVTTTALPEYIVQGSVTTASVDLSKKGKAVYVDQYGRTLDAPTATTKLLDIVTNGHTNMDFAVALEKTAGTTIEAHLARANVADTTITVGAPGKEYLVVDPTDVALGELTIKTFDATVTGHSYADAPSSNTLKLSIETKKTAEATTNYAAAGKKLTATVTTVGLDKLTNFAINSISDLVPVTTQASGYGNLKEYIDSTLGTFGTDDSLTVGGVANKDVKVTGTYNGKKLEVPAEFYEGIDDGETPVVAKMQTNAQTGKHTKAQLAVTTTTGSAIAANKLYSTTEYTRKTATLPVAVNVYTLNQNGSLNTTTVNKVSTTINVQDGAPSATTIKFYDSGANEITEGVFNASNLFFRVNGDTNNLMRITGASPADFILANQGLNVYYAVYDQYGQRIDVVNNNLGDEFKITNIKESNGPLTHVTLNGFSVTANQSAVVDVDYAEISDTFDLTVSHGGASATIAITQGSDDQAYVDNGGQYGAGDLDETFRKTFLGYDR